MHKQTLTKWRCTSNYNAFQNVALAHPRMARKGEVVVVVVVVVMRVDS